MPFVIFSESKLIRVAASVMPFILTYFSINNYMNPVLIIGILLLLGAFLSRYLSETRGFQAEEIELKVIKVN